MILHPLVFGMSKQTIIDAIADEARSCSKCPLSEGRIQAVSGYGSAEADIVFVGEGPGAQEDKKGEPFVGAAGKFLDEMLADIKLARRDVFITNIVKCRPPNNRDPLPDEVKTCTESYLWRQLDTINPLLLIPLGRHAMCRFLPEDKKIGDVHGKLFHLESEKSGRVLNVMPLYHPAAALYNGSMRPVLKADFQKIPKTLETIKKKYIEKL